MVELQWRLLMTLFYTFTIIAYHISAFVVVAIYIVRFALKETRPDCWRHGGSWNLYGRARGDESFIVSGHLGLPKW